MGLPRPGLTIRVVAVVTATDPEFLAEQTDRVFDAASVRQVADADTDFRYLRCGASDDARTNLATALSPTLTSQPGDWNV